MNSGAGKELHFLLPLGCPSRCVNMMRFFDFQAAGLLGPTQEALLSGSLFLESGLTTQAVPPPGPSSLPSPGPPTCGRASAGLPLTDWEHPTELALCLHSPGGLESRVALGIPRGRKQGAVCCATLSPAWLPRWKE